MSSTRLPFVSVCSFILSRSHVELQFYFDASMTNLSRFVKLFHRCYIFLDVKDQTELFMEKGEIRKYIPFLKLSFIYSPRSYVLSLKRTITIHKLVC